MQIPHVVMHGARRPSQRGKGTASHSTPDWTGNPYRCQFPEENDAKPRVTPGYGAANCTVLTVAPGLGSSPPP